MAKAEHETRSYAKADDKMLEQAKTLPVIIKQNIMKRILSFERLEL